MLGLVFAQTGLAFLRLFSSDFAKMADTRKVSGKLQMSNEKRKLRKELSIYSEDYDEIPHKDSQDQCRLRNIHL